jgi:hypothetical protein
MQSYNFAQPAANAVASHGAAERLLNAPAKPAAFQSIGAEENRELAAAAALAVSVDRVIFGAAQQTAFARQPARPIRRG